MGGFFKKKDIVILNSCLGKWPKPYRSGTCRDVAFPTLPFPLEKGFVNDNTNTPLNESTTKAFYKTIVLGGTGLILIWK